MIPTKSNHLPPNKIEQITLYIITAGNFTMAFIVLKSNWIHFKRHTENYTMNGCNRFMYINVDNQD